MTNKFSKKVINLINKNTSSAYNSLLFEELIYDYWEQNNLFAPTGSGEPFTVIMPPPNLTPIEEQCNILPYLALIILMDM